MQLRRTFSNKSLHEAATEKRQGTKSEDDPGRADPGQIIYLILQQL